MQNIKITREKNALILNDLVLKSGHVVKIAEGNNARRLHVREIVAKAKLKMKERNIQ